MAREGPGEESVSYRGSRQPSHQSDRGASQMDEKEQGKSASGSFHFPYNVDCEGNLLL
jgi:hypothetical protein